MSGVISYNFITSILVTPKYTAALGPKGRFACKEPTWVKVNESKFRLVEYKDQKGEDGQT